MGEEDGAHAACRSRPAPEEKPGVTGARLRSSTRDRPATWRGAPAEYTMQAFSAGFLRDLAEVWSQEGRETIELRGQTWSIHFLSRNSLLHTRRM
jgi:hypothetical protein